MPIRHASRTLLAHVQIVSGAGWFIDPGYVGPDERRGEDEKTGEKQAV